MATTSFQPGGYPGRPYGSFAGKEATAGGGPHNPGRITTLWAYGGPGHLYGDFSGKEESVEPPEPEPIPDIALPGGHFGFDEKKRGQRFAKQREDEEQRRIKLRRELFGETQESITAYALEVNESFAQIARERDELAKRVAELERVKTVQAKAELEQTRQALRAALDKQALLLEIFEVIDIAYVAVVAMSVH